MKVCILKSARADGIDYRKGAAPDLPEATANKLISRGYAEVWSPKAEIEEAIDGSAIPE